MRIISDTKLINRNRKIGQYSAIASLIIFAVGFYFSFQPDQFNLSLIALLIGVIISQVSIYFGNRWGRSPRPDEWISRGLKGLGDNYSLYHYNTPVPHLLIGPAGVWVLLPFYQGGVVQYQDGKWKQKKVNPFLRLFAQESLGRPDLDAKALIDDLQKKLTKALPGVEIPPIQSVLVFTNPKVTLDATESPIPGLTVEKLKDFIRRQAKEKPVSMDQIYSLQSVLPE
jgi:hypothetical protein